MYVYGFWFQTNSPKKKFVRNWQGLSWKLSKLTKQNTSDRWAFVVWLSWKLTRMLTIHESSLSMVEIGFWLLSILYQREKKRRRKGRRGRRERESELKWEKWTSPTLRQRRERERENDSLYFFRLVWGKKTKKKGAYYLFFCFWINWSYFTMSLLYWGLILEALSFYGKKKKNWPYLKKKIRP